MDKEAKAKEYAEGMETSFSEDEIQKSMDDFKSGFEVGYKLAQEELSTPENEEMYEAGIEAGKQERERQIIEKLKEIQKQESFEAVDTGLWTFIQELENLSK
jgi:hypothetical protein